MKEKILELIAQGKTPTEIKNELKCARSMVYYYLNDTEKAKAKIRRERFLQKNPDWEKQREDKYRIKRNLLGRIRAFQRKNNQLKSSFKFKDVLEKFGQNTVCYLTNNRINLLEDSFEFDHIIPISKGGSNDLSNLGITTPDSNRMKHNLLLEDFLEMCKTILENHNFKVIKKRVVD